MNQTVEIDEIDAKILRALTKDARTRLKDIAEDCGISSAAVCNRVKRLKASGVITGSVLFSDLSRLGFLYPATIGVSLNPSQEASVIDSVKNQVNLVFLSKGIGKDNLLFFVVAQSLQEIDNMKQTIRKQQGIKRVTVSHWSTPFFNFENIDP
jgi:Lrp/AsnC family transcriptional regulator, regulator for asnA, asnC and gidA